MILAVIQSSIVVSIALCSVCLLRRQSAATRHLILTAALFASIVTPFLRPFGSKRIQHVVAGFSPRSVSPPQQTRAEARDYIADTAETPQYSFALMTWISGLSVMVLLLLSGALRIGFLMHRGTFTVDARWARAGAEISCSLHVKRRVRLLRNHRGILGTWGFLRPLVFLPRDADTWSDDRLRVVLTHEFAHIKRFDWLVQMLAELARAVCWFNPLFWLVCRKLRAESEHACDDVVIASGFDARDYAAHLLELARTLKSSGRAWSPVLAMAQPPHLERRFVAMLNPSLDHRPASRTTALVACVVAFALAVPLAAMRPPIPEQVQPSVSPMPVVATPTPVVQPILAAKLAAKRPAPKPSPVQGLADGSVAGTVYDPSGAVVPGVTVTIRNDKIEEQTVSGETGNYEIRALAAGQYSLTAQLPGFATYRTGGIEIKPNQASKQNVTLSVGNIAERVTVTEAGQRNPAPPARTAQRIRVGGNVQAANLISQVRPIYPQNARDAGVEGIVHLQGIIGTDGSFAALHVISSTDPQLTNAALEAVRQWRYRPTLLNGEPVEVLTTIDVEFQLAQ